MSRVFSDGGPVPAPPPLRPTWTTWMWLSFAVLVAAMTAIGLTYSTTIPWR